MKKNVIMAAAMIILLVHISMLYPVEAQQISPGVSPGDNFTYRFYVTWNSQSGAEAPTEVSLLNETRLIKVTVTEVGGSVVVMNITRYLKNGTEYCTPALVNLLNGMGSGFGLVIAPNLQPNSLAYYMGLSNGTAFKIKESLYKRYPFGEREVLHAAINQTGSDYYAQISHDMYFDRKTGVMLEWRTEEIPYTDPTSKIVLIWEIMEFNVQENSSQQNPSVPMNEPATYSWTAALTIIALLASVSAILLYRRRKMRKRAAQHPPS